MRRALQIASVLLISLVPATLLLPFPGQGHPTQAKRQIAADSLQQVLEGQVVCISEEMARLRHTTPQCKKYGHLLGLKLADGTIWSFFLNPVGRQLRKNPALLGKRLRVKGRLFYDAKIIEVREYSVLGKKEE